MTITPEHPPHNGHSASPERTLAVALADLIADAEALEPQTSRPGMAEPYGQMLAEKYRMQDLDV